MKSVHTSSPSTPPTHTCVSTLFSNKYFIFFPVFLFNFNKWLGKTSTVCHTRRHQKLHDLLSLCCNPMYCSLPGSSVHGISQTRILEWVAIPFSRGSSLLRIDPAGSPAMQWILYQLSHQRSPKFIRAHIICNYSITIQWLIPESQKTIK